MFTSNTPILDQPVKIKSPFLQNNHEAYKNEMNAQITTGPIDVIEIINDQETRNFKLGILLIFIAICTWIIGLELVNAVLKGEDYKKPWMFAFITGSCFMLNFIPDLISCMQHKFRKTEQKDESERYPLISSTDSLPCKNPSLEELIEQNIEKNAPIELSKGELCVLAIQLAVIYYLYNLFVMSSLEFTTASNQTVLGSTTSIFTLFIGVLLKIDKFSIKKLICILVSTTGVFLIGLSESKKEPTNDSKFEPKNPKLGNTLAILGALMYALYLIIMKVRCGTGNRTTNERQLFGFVGLFTFILGLPILYLVDSLNIEPFEFPPPNNQILISIMINGVFSIISDYTTILAMLLTSPLVTSLSLTSAIPITIFIDYIIISIIGSESSNLNFIYFLGVSSILVSVILINVNITSENELIEEVIEDALEEAIREDEVLSPLISPLLSPKSNVRSAVSSPYVQTDQSIHIGIHSPALLSSFSPRFTPKIKSPQLLRAVSGFNLNQDNQSDNAPKSNLNHSSTLYSINTEISNQSTIDSNKTNLLVYGGNNHRYHVVNLDSTLSDVRLTNSDDNIISTRSHG